MFIRKRIAIIGAVAAATAFGYATPASAQATRTWVSGVGDDVNPCSRTAPCKTFAGAISKTAAGGEINCLDPGGFGAVSIIKSMTISCPYTEGGALAGGNGITVNMPATTDVAFIRGLDIFGVNPPTNGIRFINNGTLHIEDTVIRRFNAASSFGVSMATTGPSELYISNTTIAENGNAATGGGILVQPGLGGSAKVFLNNVRVHNNANQGVRIDTSSMNVAAGITAVIDDSSLVGNEGNGLIVNAPTFFAVTMVANSDVNNNTTGMTATGASSRIRVGNTTIHGNGTGVSIGVGSSIQTYLDNRLDGNGTDNAFTAPSIPKK